MFTPKDAPKANDLIAVLREANQVVNPKLLDLCTNSYSKGRNRGRPMGGGGGGGNRDRQQMDRDRFNRNSRMNSNGGGAGDFGDRDRDRSRSAATGRTRFDAAQATNGGSAGLVPRQNGRPSRFDKPQGAIGTRFGGSNGTSGSNSAGGGHQLRSFTHSATSNGFNQPPPSLMSFTAR